MFEVYGLIDPISNKIRYIGYTSDPKSRILNHINTCNKKKYENCYKAKWIRKLLKDNLKPIYKTLVRTSNLEDIKQLEIDYISHYKTITKLTNYTKGGDGTTGLKWSEESRRKISIARKGKLKLHLRYKIEGLNMKTGEYKIFTEKTEASKYIQCSEKSLTDVNSGRRNSVNNWKVNFIKKGAQ